MSIILIAILLFFTRSTSKLKNSKEEQIKNYLTIEFVDFEDPFHIALLKDVLNIYYPGQHDKNNEIVKAIQFQRSIDFNESLEKSHLKEKLSVPKFIQILKMYFKFLIVYIIVMILTYYGVQTLGVWRFVKKKRSLQMKLYHSERSTGSSFLNAPLTFFKILAKGIVYFIFFSPAYVIAYSIRTEFNTDTLLFMVLLAVISNGLLVMYANKFYSFLVAESRKGYVQTAIVKNMNTSYSQNDVNGISYKALFRPLKKFKGHIFEHIFRNAQYQYFTTIKEQASFLITGLIIIEMALNIHGHLSYEMLRQILYKNYDLVIVIILGIFYTVKLTEIITDFIAYSEALKYENR